MRSPISQSIFSRRIRRALSLCDESLRVFGIGNNRAPGDKGLRLGRQSQLRARPDFEAIDPSIRPVAPPGTKPAEVVRFPPSKSVRKGAAADESVAGFWAY